MTVASTKLKWEILREGPQQVVLLSGPLNENSDLDELADKISGSIVLDLEGVDHINSCGVRDWILFVERMGETGQQITLRRCSPPFVGQLNMVYNFKGSTCSVQSVMAPFICESCGMERTGEVPITGPDVRLAQLTCQQCGKPMDLDQDEERYFLFAKY